MVLSALIVRLRTVADGEGVTVRTLLGSRTVRWDDIDGLRFHRGSWARAQLKSGEELRLPAVTFATLPLLTEASAAGCPTRTGEQPSAGSGDRVDAVEQHPHRDAAADAGKQRDERPDEGSAGPAAAGVEPVAPGPAQDDRGSQRRSG